MTRKQPQFRTGLILAVFAAILAAACGGAVTSTPTEGEGSAAPRGQGVKVAILFSGLVTGQPWNSRAYEGLLKAKDEYGVEVSYTDNLSDADMEAAFRDYASQGYKIVIGHSFGFNDAAVAASKDFPDTVFAVTVGSASSDNVAAVKLKEQENSYLAGVLAALVSKTGTLGMIGGFEYPSIVMPFNAFFEGAKSINPNIRVVDAYVGSWQDPAKGQELAASMIENGADVIFHKAGGSGIGVSKAAEAAGVWSVPEVSSCMQEAPKACLTSQDAVFEKVVPYLIGLYIDGGFKGGVYEWGIKEGAVDLGPINSAVPQEHVDRVMQIRQQILDGTLTVPEEYEPAWK